MKPSDQDLPATLPADIRDRIHEEFGPKRAPGILREIADAMPRFHQEPARVARCAVFLSRGDLRRLRHNLKVGQEDFRDLIYWAEYDAHDRRLRDFNRPFGQAEL